MLQLLYKVVIYGTHPQLYSWINLHLFLVETSSVCLVDRHGYRDQVEQEGDFSEYTGFFDSAALAREKSICH